jgi:malonyl-CoA/methylmalonyl-CoA synthetase
VSRYLNALSALGVRSGDRVVVQVDKSLPSLLLYLACLKGGYIFVPLNTAYKASELNHFVADAEPALFVTTTERFDEVSALVADVKTCSAVVLSGSDNHDLSSLSEGQPELAPTRATDPGEVAVIIYTSGTTGRSKGAMVTHENLISNVTELTQLWEFSERDALLHALPIFHVHGLFIANHCALTVGAKILWLDRFDVEEIAVALPQATVMMGVPTFYTRLLKSADFTKILCREMRLFISGSAPMLLETHKLFEKRTGHKILERYGMSEAGMITSNPYRGARKVGTVGKALPGVSVRIVDDVDVNVTQGGTGHIQIKGPNVFAGYRNMPKKTEEEFTPDGWFRTGDLGALDEEGYLTIVGRSKDLIITGGYNVYPKEIELVLDADPRVLESAVFGIKHSDFGEAVTAAIVLNANSNLDTALLIENIKTKLASYKVPKAIYVLDQLPRNAMGKVQKSLLREVYSSD